MSEQRGAYAHGTLPMSELFKKCRVYLSGPMSGLPEYNRPAFNEEATRLRSKGYDIFNPAEISLPQYPKNFIPASPEESEGMWKAYMRECIKGLVDCNEVAVLPGWEKSKGANIEVKLALDLGMPIVEVGTQEIMKGS